MKQKAFIILLSMILCGCQSGSQQSKTGELVEIDISKNYPTKEIHLQNVADIEYIPLETTDDILLGGSCRIEYFSDKYIVIRDNTQRCVFVFDRNGKIITHLNQNGQGDKEYTYISSAVFDEKNEEIFIADIASTHRILVYSLTGEYKRTLKYADDLSLSIYNFDEETLLVYDENGLRQNEYREDPYMLMSKKDGSIVSNLDIRMPVRYSNRGAVNYTDESGQMMTQAISIVFSNNRYYGQDFVIADMSLDTIYRLTKNKELTPRIVRTPSVHSSEPRTVWGADLITEKFIILEIGTIDFESVRRTQSVSSTTLIYEFETGEIGEVSFLNDEFLIGNVRFQAGANTLAKNTTTSLMQVSHLVEAYKEKQLKGVLEKLVSTLDEDDNPVVAIYKFK